MSPPETEDPKQTSCSAESETHPVLLELQRRRREKLERYYMLRRQGNHVPALALSPAPSTRPLVGPPRQPGWRRAHSAPEHKLPPDPSGGEVAGDRLRPSTATTRIPYHTAITRPPPPTRGQPKFDALTRPFVPLPRLHDASPPAASYRKVSIRHWKEQVTRVVPERPEFSQSIEMTSSTREMPIADDFVHAYPSVFFYRSYRGRKRPGANREYVVNPDWVSETPRQRSMDSSGLRYGWCA